MARRSLAVLAALAVCLVTLGGSAGAQYPPSSVACSVSASVVVQGGSVLFSCSGFAPNSNVDIDDNGQPATLAARRFGAAGVLAARPLAITVLNAPANNDGTILVRVAFARNAALGPHVLRATGVGPDGNGKVGAATVTVIPAPAGGGLPNTGSNSTLPAVAIGLGLVLAGAAIVFVSRRYRHARLV